MVTIHSKLLSPVASEETKVAEGVIVKLHAHATRSVDMDLLALVVCRVPPEVRHRLL